MPIAAAPKDLESEFLRELSRLPAGEKIKECIQCGTCSASCPTSAFMDYAPRQIIAALRAGDLARALSSNTVWMCASCYSCTVRCPSGIMFTDVMYELKRLSERYGLTPKKTWTPSLAKTFVDFANRYGRNYETGLVIRLLARYRPSALLSMAPMALALFRRGRLSLLPRKIQGRDQLSRIIASVTRGK